MQDKRVRFICKNIILIAMTLSLLIFFGGSHAVMGRFMAAENDWPEGTESTEGAEFVYGEEELDTTTEDTESSENTEISEHTESTENTQTTETEENLPPVTPEGAAVAVEYVGFIGDGTGAKSLYYTSLQAAFDGLSTITDAQSALSVVLLQDMVLTETLVNTSDANFLLDLAGHTMTLAPGVQINYGNGKVRLTTGTGSHGGIQCGSVASYGPAAGSDVVDHPETSEEDQEEAAGDVTAEEPEAGNTEEPEGGETPEVPENSETEEPEGGETPENPENSETEEPEGGETPEAPENGVQVPLEDQPVLQPLMVGTGELTFLKGTYENAYGSVASGFDKINAEGGYFIAGGADVFTEIVTDITISDNTNMFFGVDAGYEVLGTSEAVMNLPEGKVLVRATVSLDGRTLRGYVVGDPDYAVNGNGVTTYYGTFDKAYEYAREASLGTGLIHSITLLDPEITEVPVEESYVQSATEGAVPQIHIIGMNLVRDIRFTGEMFRVNAGKLVLTDCMVCGNVAEEGYVEGGLIVVAGEATLTLRGDEKGTVITGNRGLYTTDHEEAGAGIVLAEGATLDLAGNVSVANNYERYLNPAGEDELFARNIYLLGNANIVISGPITSGSQEHRTIGFSYRVPVVDKITRFGSFGSAYEAELNLNQQDVDMEELLGAIQLDGNALYFLEYEAGELYWTMNQEELPEAGIFRGEYILLLLGLAGLLLRNAKNVKERELVVTYLTALSIVSVALGAGIGVAHFRMDIAAYKASTLAVSQMEYDYNLAGATADETSLLVTQGGQDSTQLGTQQFRLNVPDDGRTYVGIVEVEECGIKLPVLASYTDADLKTTPCVYTGDALTDDLVIVGHNYDSQFASLNDIDGDVHVILTLMDGTVIHYESFAKEALDPSEIDEMIHGDWDLTLFTCSYSGEKRIAIRCDRKD